MRMRLLAWQQAAVRGIGAIVAIAMTVVAPTRAARTFDLSSASIVDINTAFDAGALTSEQLTRLYLARIAAYDKVGPRLNSVLYPETRRSMSSARASSTARGLMPTPRAWRLIVAKPQGGRSKSSRIGAPSSRVGRSSAISLSGPWRSAGSTR